MSNCTMINIEKSIEVSSCGLSGTMLAFAYRNWEKPWTSSVRIIPFHAKIWTYNPGTQNRSAESCQCVNNSENMLAVTNVGHHHTADMSPL